MLLVLRGDAVGANLIAAHVSAANDGVPGDNTGKATVRIDPEADLGITLQGPASASTAQSVSIAFQITNQAQAGASNLAVAIDLPAGFSAQGATLANGACVVESGSIRCSLASLASGATANGTASVMASVAGDAALHASISGSYVDPNGSNDSADLTVRVTAQAGVMAAQATSSGGGSFSLLLLALAALAGLRCFAPRRRPA